MSHKDTTLRVQEKQNKQTVDTDKRRGGKDMNFECGSFIRVRKPGVLRKGQSKFSAPLQVMDQRGSYTYKLSDGWIWNASNLASACQRNARDDAEPPLLPDITAPPAQDTSESMPVGRDARIRRPPVWTQDDVMM